MCYDLSLFWMIPAPILRQQRSRSRSRSSPSLTDPDEDKAGQLLPPDKETNVYQSVEYQKPLEEEEMVTLILYNLGLLGSIRDMLPAKLIIAEGVLLLSFGCCIWFEPFMAITISVKTVIV